jgi:Phosphotransferase enzyme family
MTPTSYTKHYRDPHRAAAARTHLEWLRALDSGVRLPELLATRATSLRFEHLGERHPEFADLPAVAQALGRLHAAAHRHLPGARLNRPYSVSNILTLPDFIANRRHVITGILPGLLPALPASIYKDANVRNVLMTGDGVALIDFDDLTLAPFGYDLAKLIVSAAMTYGHLPADIAEGALTVYNQAAYDASYPGTGCTLELLRLYADIHRELTAPYLGRNGYHHDWAQVSPWRTEQVHPR